MPHAFQHLNLEYNINDIYCLMDAAIALRHHTGAGSNNQGAIMKKLLIGLCRKLAQYIETENYKYGLEHHDGHGSLGVYSVLCSLEKK